MAVLGFMGLLSDGGHDVRYLVVLGPLLLLAGVAAFRGSRAAAVLISVLSALLSVALIWMMVQAPALSVSAVAANTVFVVMLLVPSIVTAAEWSGRPRQ